MFSTMLEEVLCDCIDAGGINKVWNYSIKIGNYTLKSETFYCVMNLILTRYMVSVVRSDPVQRSVSSI